MDKQELFELLYDELKAKLNAKGMNFFDKFLLQSYYEVWMKMQKNKAKYTCQTWLLMILEIPVGLISSLVCVNTFIGSSKSIVDKVGSIVSMIAEQNKGNAVNIKEWILVIGAIVFICFVTVVIIFGIYKFLKLSLKEFKPKETWVRHSKQFYALSMEIMKYLDRSNEYTDNGIRPLTDDEAYALFQTRIIKIWEANQEKFISNMSAEQNDN